MFYDNNQDNNQHVDVHNENKIYQKGYLNKIDYFLLLRRECIMFNLKKLSLTLALFSALSIGASTNTYAQTTNHHYDMSYSISKQNFISNSAINISTEQSSKTLNRYIMSLAMDGQFRERHSSNISVDTPKKTLGRYMISRSMSSQNFIASLASNNLERIELPNNN